MLGIGMGLLSHCGRPSWTPAQLPPGIAKIWLRDQLSALRALDDGTGDLDGLSDASTLGQWTEVGGNHLRQATSGSRPFVGYHPKGGVCVAGDGLARSMRSISSVSGASIIWAAAAVVGPDLLRNTEPAEPAAFASNYQTLAANDAVANPASALLVGEQYTNRWMQTSGLEGTYYRDGSVVSPADVGPQRVWEVHEYERNSAANAGNFLLFRYPSNILYWLGAAREILVTSTAISAEDRARVRAYFARHRRGPLLVCTGDSLVAGRLVTNHEAWPSVVWEDWRRALSVANIGVPGQTSAQLVSGDPAKLAALAGEHSPRTVLVAIGANDFLNGLSGTLTNLQTYTTAAKAAGWRVIWTTVAPAPLYSGPQNTARLAFNAAAAAGWEAAGADGFIDIAAVAPEVGGDNIHWTAAGHAAVAAAVAPVAIDLL